MVTYPITIQVPDELAAQLNRRAAEIPQILELGLREVEAQRQLQFDGAADVLEFLAGLPTPDEVLALRPSAALQSRIDALLDKSRAEGLTAAEEEHWQQIEYLEHLVRMAKAKARQRLNE
jgi:hypothetical protein